MTSFSEARRPIGSPAPSKETKASLTTTCAIDTGSGPSFRTVSSIRPGSSTVRSTASASAGGPCRSPRPGPPSAEKAPIAATISSNGTSPSSHAGARRVMPRASPAVAWPASISGPPLVGHLEEAHPPELGELRLVGVEHVLARVREAHLEDPALTLTEHHGVGELAALLARPRRDVVKEVAVQVKRVDQVVFQDVDEIQAHELAPLDANRLLGVGEADRVGGVDLVGAIEVRVEAVHDHDHLVGRFARVRGIDEKRSVQALGYVLGERAHV